MKNRVLKLNGLIQQELSRIILREIDFPKEVLLTVTRVEVSDDIHQAKAYISVLPEEKFFQAIDNLKKQIYTIQQNLNKKLKMRPVPRVFFVKEKMTREAEKIEKLLEEIKKNNEK
jgi:ribosome-binding factor A